MDFKIQDVPKSSVSEFSFGAMACCIISYQVLLAEHHGELTRGAFMIICAAGIIFVGWLIWFFRMYLGGKKVAVMPRKIGMIVEISDWILFAIWVLTSWVSSMCHPAWAIASWCLWAATFIYYLIFMSKYSAADAA